MDSRLRLSPQAAADLENIYDYFALHSSIARAEEIIRRLLRACDNLAAFTQLGASRSRVRPGLRILPVARRVTIAYHVHDAVVVIDRILHRGQDIGAALTH